ncbi:MAG: hypothetical protein JZU47_10925 [Prolixibacteraceae bacterium]|nr:hypothetical protein [Prolixibacteraceae bacterium]
MLKNPKYSPKPQVTISLEPILEAFLRFIFKTPADQEAITINLQKDLGKLIHSHVHSNHCFRKGPSVKNPVTIILPVNKTNHHGIQSGFLFVDDWGLQKIENGIEYEYRKWIERRFENGYRKNNKQKAIIEAILRGLNVRNNCANFDAIKQIDYRNLRKEEELRFESLLESDS